MDGDLNTMVQNILQNPEFASLVKEIKGENGGSTEIDTEKIMAKLPQMLSMLGMQGGEKEKEDTASETTADTPGNEETTTPPHSGKTEGFPSGLTQLWKPGSMDKRNKLLCALKPYLSPARCSLIDKALNAIQLGEVLGVMQSAQTGSPSDGKSG